MKRLMSMTCLGVICTVVGVGAQADTMAKKGMEMKKDGPMMVTGCVAKGDAAGMYQLTNAMKAADGMAGDSMGKGMAKGKDSMAGDHAMTYALMGGTGLDAHVGHKVTVTGTMGKKKDGMGNMDMAKKDGMGKSSTTDSMAKPMAGGTLNVTSVKMISANCP